MAAVLDTKTDPATKFDTKVDEQLAEATSRIRFHDITFGALLAGGMALAYFTAMIVLDKYLVLPEWVRQLSLGGFLVALGAAVWYTIIRPLRREINPLYAAVQVERTVDDAKNSVVGYVDAKGNDKVHPTVRAAMGARAAKSAAQADLNQAVDHRSLIYAGGVVVALALALVVLFFVFRPAQFRSLTTRALMPFSSSAIATRTQLSLVKPDPADSTITSGQSVTVAVFVAGKVPAADGPERVRLMLRHNPADPNYEVVPMERGETNRDWTVRVPDYLVQNGFWYKVAAGDAETPEHKITVRTAPLFTDFEANYEFPAYLRMKPQTGVKGNRLVAFRGTKVTLFAKTNREVKDGRMDVDPTGEKAVGRAVNRSGSPDVEHKALTKAAEADVANANRKDTLQFEYKLVENGSYRLHFTATNGERNTDPPPFAIQVLSDLAPTLTILKPEEDEIPLPANGQLAVDATIGDDFGIDKAWLKVRIAGETEKLLADKPYLEGKSFLRATDNTWPTVLDYKDSLDLGKLKDAAGLGVELKEGTLLEYWLEAADNCTEPKANVGKSNVKRVRLTAPVKEPEPMQKQDTQKEQRKTEEKKHNDDQQKRLDNEDRKPPQQDGNPNPEQKKDGTGEAKKDNNPQAGGKDGEGKKDNNPPEQKKDGTNPAGMNDTGMPPPKDEKKDPMNPPEKGGMGQKGDANPMKGDSTQKGANDPMNGGMGNNGMPESAPPPRDPGSRELDDQANKVQDKINEDKKNEGNGKPNPGANENARTDPAQPKPQPMNGPKPEDGTQKEPPKPADPMNPMGGGNAAESKPEGKVKPPPAASEPKPNDPKSPKGGEKGNAGEPKPQPAGTTPGQEQPEPKAGGANDQKGGEPKPAGKPPEGGEQPKEPKSDAGQPKPMNEPTRGGDNAPPPKDGGQPEPKSEAGDGKPEKTPQAGAGKPAPKDPANPMDAAAPKPPPQGKNDPMMPQAGNPGEPKPDRNPPGTPENKGGERGMDQGDPQANNGGEKKNGEPKGGAGEKKLDPKEIADAAKDLNSPDPDKKKAAQDKLDKQIGKENREAAEKLAKDLQSPDKATREAAEKKLEGMKKQADEMAKKDGKGGDKQPGGGGEKPDPKAVEQAVKDLNSPDQKTREAAKDKLEKQLGEKGRQKAEEIAKDLNSGDFDKRGEAADKLNDLKKEAEKKRDELAKNGGGEKPPGDKKMSKEEADELAKKAADLASKDDAKRKAAEKELDEKIGKENREKLQDIAKDMQSGDPKKQEDAKKRLGEMAGTIDPTKKRPDGTPGDGPPNARTILDDAKKRLESSQLQLIEFQKNQFNKDLQKKLGWSQEEYDRFLKDVEKRTEDLKAQVAEAEKEAEKLPPLGTPTQNVSGAGKVAGRKDNGTAAVGGTTFAPPGFGDAAAKFREDALKFNSTPKK